MSLQKDKLLKNAAEFIGGKDTFGSVVMHC